MTDILKSMEGFYTLQDAVEVGGVCAATCLIMLRFGCSKGWTALVVVILGAAWSPLVHVPGAEIHGRARWAWNARHIGIGAIIGVAVVECFKAILKKLRIGIEKGDDDEKPKFPPTSPE